MSDYEVGYKKPPKKHRFKKGQSGNPNGRPRKTPPQPRDDSPAAVLKRADERTIPVNGSEYTPFALEVMALQAKAAKGDVAASRQLTRIRKELGLLTSAPIQVGGVLVVPGPMDEADFEKLAFKQQAPFRERTTDYDEKGKKEPDDDLG
ncbi:MAG: DUF5681 domain-containing protein [Alphaproteobacteria bacterium]